MVAAFDAQPQFCHWEAVHACVFALADHNATPRLVYIAAQLSHLLDRLPAGSIHRKTPAAVVCLVRWARANAHELSLSIAHLLLLKPLGEESPDVSIVVMLLHSWLEATSSPPGPEALQAALAKLHQGGRSALRQELSLCDDTTTRALENLLLLIPADGVDSEQGGIEVAGKRGRSADEVGRLLVKLLSWRNACGFVRSTQECIVCRRSRVRTHQVAAPLLPNGLAVVHHNRRAANFSRADVCYR